MSERTNRQTPSSALPIPIPQALAAVLGQSELASERGAGHRSSCSDRASARPPSESRRQEDGRAGPARKRAFGSALMQRFSSPTIQRQRRGRGGAGSRRKDIAAEGVARSLGWQARGAGWPASSGVCCGTAVVRPLLRLLLRERRRRRRRRLERGGGFVPGLSQRPP
jgi:hypothetical protein